jgi:hypothetical protein
LVLEPEVLRVAEQNVPVAERDDRRAVRVIVRFEHLRGTYQDGDAQADERHDRHEGIGRKLARQLGDAAHRARATDEAICGCHAGNARTLSYRATKMPLVAH